MQELYGASGYFIEAEANKKKPTSENSKLTEVTVSDKLESLRAAKEVTFYIFHCESILIYNVYVHVVAAF